MRNAGARLDELSGKADLAMSMLRKAITGLEEALIKQDEDLIVQKQGALEAASAVARDILAEVEEWMPGVRLDPEQPEGGD